MKDEDLTRILQEWRVKPTMPIGFQREVWDRIATARAPQSKVGLRAFWQWLFPTSGAWQLAAAVAGVMMLLAGALGTTTARTEAEVRRAEIGQRFAASIDPYLRLAEHHP